MSSRLTNILLKYQSHYHEVVSGSHQAQNLLKVDMSKDNEVLMKVDVNNTQAFTQWMEGQLSGKVGWGGYMEHREIYRRSTHFDGKGEPRSLHLGIDLWAPAGTPIFSPIDAIVESCVDNKGFADYGPTIILKHQLDDITFYTLYGHLSRASLSGISVGKKIIAGARLATLGDNEENGNWPPHLHFQVMSDLKGKIGDFPGVAAMSERAIYENICPDPNIILQLGNTIS